MLWHWIVKIVLCAGAGFFAGKLMDSEGRGLIGNTLLGLAGGGIGTFLARRLLHLYSNGSFIYDLLISIVGACILIWVVRLISGKKKS